MLRDDSDDVDGFSGAHVIRSESAIDLTNAVSDFYKYGKKEAFQVIQKRGNYTLPEKVVLHTRRRNYPIKTLQFIQHSKKIRDLADKNDLPRVVDLTSYNVDSVRSFVDFICGVDKRNFRLSPAIMLDLLHLARIFHMKGLIEMVAKSITKSIDLTGAENERKPIGMTLMLNLSLVTQDWSLALDENLRKTLYAVAADAFPQMWKMSSFRKLPLSILQLLLSRCDLEVADEFEAASAALVWLSHGSRTDAQVVVVARTVRTALIPKDKLQQIFEKAKKSGLAEKQVQLFEEVLRSDRNMRCCVIRQHMKPEFRRCGTPSEEVVRFYNVGRIEVVPTRPKKTGSAGTPSNSESARGKKDAETSVELKNLDVCGGKLVVDARHLISPGAVTPPTELGSTETTCTWTGYIDSHSGKSSEDGRRKQKHGKRKSQSQRPARSSNSEDSV